MTSIRMIDFLKNMINTCGIKNHLFILDNAVIHKTLDIQNLINNTGNKILYTVPYNPSTNPIENWFSQFKYWLSNSTMRTFEMLQNDIKTVITKITRNNYFNYFNYAYNKTMFKFTKNKKTLIQIYKK